LLSADCEKRLKATTNAGMKVHFIVSRPTLENDIEVLRDIIALLNKKDINWRAIGSNLHMSDR
jgi:hypothetical protein